MGMPRGFQNPSRDTSCQLSTRLSKKYQLSVICNGLQWFQINNTFNIFKILHVVNTNPWIILGFGSLSTNARDLKFLPVVHSDKDEDWKSFKMVNSLVRILQAGL